MRLFFQILAVLVIAGSLLAVPDDLENSYQSLKEAEAKKDAAQVKKLAAETSALARQAISEPAPEGSSEKPAWETRIAHARSIDSYTEYALYVIAIQGPAAVTLDLLSALEQQNPKSKYLDDAYGTYFVALKQTGATPKIAEVAGKAIAQFPDNEDLLLVLADNAMNNKQSDRALRHAERLTVVLGKHPKPESVSAADWERKRTAALGRGYWIAGMVCAEKNQHSSANKQLRAALPLIKGNDAMMEAALFHLGVANYQLGKLLMKKAQVLEGVEFSKQAAAFGGRFASQARHNALVMSNEAITMR